MNDIPIRAASTIILLRDFDSNPRVLMGQRGAEAAFMPNKFVFPGGAVDETDADISLLNPLPPNCYANLQDHSSGRSPDILAVAAIRELWEETGLILGKPREWPNAPSDWAGFAEAGCRPSAENLFFFFRAITPPGKSRRFDARFFLTSAEHLANDPDDFSMACDELSHLQWVPLDKVRSLNLPFITSIVLGEISGLAEIGPPKSVPFFQNNDEESLFLRLQNSVK